MSPKGPSRTALPFECRPGSQSGLCTVHGLQKCQKAHAWPASLHTPPASPEQCGPALSQAEGPLGEAQSLEDQAVMSGATPGQGAARGNLRQQQPWLCPAPEHIWGRKGA